MNGHPVNVLSAGREYRFDLSGEFLSDRDGIYFGLHIGSISGTVVTGQTYPELGKYIESVRSGQHFRITYRFNGFLTRYIFCQWGGMVVLRAGMPASYYGCAYVSSTTRE